MKIQVITLLFFFCILSAQEANELYSFDSDETKNRFYSLNKEIGCPMCSGSSIDGSSAPIAQDMKDLVYELMMKGKKNSEIKDVLTSKFGNEILFMPPANNNSIFLFIFPFIVVLVSGYLIINIRKNDK